jgi:hypothetical protein
MSSILAPIATAFFQALAPLEAAVADPVLFRLLVRDLGWDVEISDDVLAQLPIAASLPERMEQGREIFADLEAGGDGVGALVLDLLDLVDGIVTDVRALDGFSPTGDVPAELRDPAYWADLALLLPGVLVARRLESASPLLHRLLRIAGVIEITELAAGPGRSQLRQSLSFARLADLIGDPVGYLQGVYDWGATGGWRHDALLEELRLLLYPYRRPARRAPVRALFRSGPTRLYTPTNPALDSTRELIWPLVHGKLDGGWAELGALLVPAPQTPGGPVTGLLLANLTYGSTAGSVPLADGWTLQLTGGLDTSGAVGILIQPGDISFHGTGPAVDASLVVTGTPAAPIVLLGTAGGLRLEARGVEAGLALRGTGPDVEVWVRAVPDTTGGGLALVVQPGDADSMVRGLAGSTPLEVGFDLELSWSSSGGFQFGGSAGFELALRLDKTIGPLTLDELTVALARSGGDTSLEVGISFSLVLGPFILVIERIGLRAGLVDASDPAALVRFGDTGVELGLLPPKGVGIGIDAEGIVTGGGFLRLEPEIGRYSGVAQLAMLGLGLTVVGIVETQLPGDPDGWSLFLSVIVDFTPIQIGFGFTLNGVGGFMGLHRTLDDVALVEGVREGRLDSLLFPTDPLAEATRILADIEAYFPSQDGQYAFGAMVKIGWGTPSLVTAEVGVILTLPDVRLAVVGELGSVLPNAELALLELHMGVVGVIDFAAGTLMVAASIYDSQLVGLTLSGDMAMYMSVGTGAPPYFLFTVGGFNPGWSPPSSVPASVRDTRRMSASIDLAPTLEVGLDAYLAITPNTLQFGAEVYAVARVHTLGVDFSADGTFGFDVQITFSPFLIAADMYATVAVRADGRPLLSVGLRLHVEGPKPWSGTGFAEFQFLWWDVAFRVAVGAGVADESDGTVSLWPELERALADPDSWAATASLAAMPDVCLRPLDPLAEAGMWLAPDSRVEVRQSVLPLNRDIEVYGALVPTGENGFDVEAAGLTAGVGTAWERVQDWFAPAQYTRMTPGERLSAPSFELMDAGVALSGTGYTAPTAAANVASVVLGYEQKILEPEQPLGWNYSKLDPARMQTGVNATQATGAVAKPASDRYTVTVPALAVGSTRYAVVEALDAEPVSGWGGIAVGVGVALPYADAVGLRRALARSRPAGEARLRIVPSHAVAGGQGR